MKNLNDLPKIRLADLAVAQQEQVRNLCPHLYDFALHYDDKEIVDIDFYFDDDPLLGQPDYTGYSLSGFVYGSETYNRLNNVIDFLSEVFYED